MQSDVHIKSSSEEQKTNMEPHQSTDDPCILPVTQISHTNLISLVVNEINEIAVIHKTNTTDEKFYACISTDTMHDNNNVEDAIAFDIEKKLGVDVRSVKYLNSFFYHDKQMLNLGFVCKVNKEEFRLSTDIGHATWMNIYDAGKRLKDCSLSIFLLKNYLESE